MGKVRRTKALFLLLTMVSMMVHNALPHFHHQHDPVAHENVLITSEHTHDHDHGHDHDHSEEKPSQEEKSNDLFNLLLEGHAHSSHSHRVTPIAVQGLKSQKLQVESSHFLAGISREEIIHESDQKRYSLYQQRIYHHPYQSNPSLRGPPAMV